MLNKYQQQIVHSDENLLIIAGAGCGKTFTLIEKVKYLINEKNIKEEEILLISFTNASVNDIKKKINYNIEVLTFHKLALKILKNCSIEYKIINEYTLDYIIKEYLLKLDVNKQKVILKYLNFPYSYKKFLKSNWHSSFCNNIKRFILNFKANMINYNEIKKIKLSKSEKSILLIYLDILKLYEEEKNSTHSFDFDDLIIKSEIVARRQKFNYKYIIIDEFQDTSKIRLNLIISILNNSNAHLIVVGDDYQSIYHFSGCSIFIFLNIHKYLPNIRKLFLIETYRNSQELLKISQKFITQNPYQIKKELESHLTQKNPVVLIPYKNPVEALKKLLDELINKGIHDIMIIYRNNRDIYNYIDNSYIFENETLIYKNISIHSLTIHKSKGLESDYVIILNCNNDIMGFPNKIEDSILIQKLFNTNEIPYAEERRLMYVAITRTKNIVYLLYNKSTPSIFVKEIKKLIKAS